MSEKDIKEPMKVPLAQHELRDEDKRAAMEVLDSGFLTRGPKGRALETKIAEYTGTKYAIGTSSGTTALHLALIALGIGEGDLVITTPLSFIASSNSILFQRAKPVFVDVESHTFQIDPALVEKKVVELLNQKKPVKAILAVDLFGYVADWPALRKIADTYHLKLIEDSCEALGASMTLDGRTKMAGSFGDVGVFGFFPNKQIAAGEGGVVVTDNEEVDHLVRTLKNHGADPKNTWDQYEMLGYNYHLTEMSAALTLSQLNRIEDIVQQREVISEKYKALLSGVSGIVLPPDCPNMRVSRFVYVIQLAGDTKKADRDNLMQYMMDRGITTRNYFPSIHLSPFYVKEFGFKEGDFPVSETFSDRSLALPFFHAMTDDEMHYVVKHLVDGLAHIRQS